MGTVVKLPPRPGDNQGQPPSSGKQAPPKKDALRAEVQPKHWIALGGVVLAIALIVGLVTVAKQSVPVVDSDRTSVNVSSPEKPAPANIRQYAPGRGAGVAGDAIPQPDADH